MNPYDPPAEPSKFNVSPTGVPEPTMQYMRSYNIVFENPNWVTNVLLCTVSMLIPVVGPIVLLGYQYTMIEAWHLRRTKTYPDFDFGQFGDLLMRGVWPFLVSLLAQVVITPIIMMFFFGGMMCMGVMGGMLHENGGDAMGAICGVLGVLIGVVAFIILSVLPAIVMMPMMLAAGLSQEIGPAFNFGFIFDFIGKMWKEVILAVLFVAFSGMLLAMLGALVFCVGMYVAIAVVLMANSHITWQLYEIYLSRGGMPIPLKPQPAPVQNWQ